MNASRWQCRVKTCTVMLRLKDQIIYWSLCIDICVTTHWATHLGELISM